MPDQQNKHPAIVDHITQRIVDDLKENLVCVLLYGSSQLHEHFWDLDIIIILSKKKAVISDLRAMRNVVSFFKDQSLDLQILYSDEITSADTFSLDAHGAFFAKILQNATVLYGENPFVKLDPSDETRATSLINRIQRYIFQARQEYIGGGRYNKDHNPQYHQKHFSRVMFDLMLLFESSGDAGDAEKFFKERFPDVLSASDWALLDSPSDDINDYMSLYEKVYAVALAELYVLIPSFKRRLGKGMVEGTVFEYLLPESFDTAIILLDGLPRQPELSSFMNLLCSWGYAVFYPRLKGTWESAGEFLNHDPTEDVLSFARHLKAGTVVKDSKGKVENIIVIGASFGGMVAISASIEPVISYVIALSPVYAMSLVPGIETLSDFLKSSYGGAYRYAENNWERLLRDEILSFEKTASHDNFDGKKCVVLGGATDKEVTVDVLKKMTAKDLVGFQILPTGHLSFHKDIFLVRPLLYKLLQNRKLTI